MIVRCGKMRKSSAKNGSGGSDPSPSMPRIVEVEATATECYSDRREDDDECDDGVKKMKNRRKLKRHEYRLRCKELLSNFKIPYLRISPNPFSIAFLILVIISSDVWPHTKSSLYVSCTPVLFRHYNHKMLTTKVNQQQNVSKSNNLILNDVSNVAGSNGGLSLPTYDKSSSAATSLSLRPFSQQQQRRRSNDNNSNNYDKYVNKTGEMFLKRQSSSSSYSSSSSFEAPDEPSPQRSHEFLIDKRRRRRRRYGRSYKPYSTSISSNHHNNTWYPAPSSTRVDDYSGTQSRSFSKSSSTTSSLISPCSHVGDETNEISARAYMAETIFEAKVRSKSTVHEPGGKYGVTFVVQNVHKDPGNSQNLLIMNTPVRLYFKQKLTTTKPTAHCVQRYNYTRRPGDLTKANIKRGRRYIVFVNGIGPHNYTILGEPVLKTKKNLQAVRDVLCRNCVRPIGVWGLKNVSVDLGKPLHLVCRVKGNPLPALQWFKDGSPIIVTSRLRIQYKKKRSLVVIPEVRNSDAGRYECRGLGVQSLSPVSSSATVDINTRVNNNLWPLAGKPCPMDLVYCLNGGSCTFYETIGEFTCQCADGFNGARCESKDAINSNSTYAYTCIDGVTPSYPCVTVHKPLD